MRVNHHLPGSLRSRGCTEALPVFNVELAVELAQPTVPLHHELCGCIAHVILLVIGLPVS